MDIKKDIYLSIGCATSRYMILGTHRHWQTMCTQLFWQHNNKKCIALMEHFKWCDRFLAFCNKDREIPTLCWIMLHPRTVTPSVTHNVPKASTIIGNFNIFEARLEPLPYIRRLYKFMIYHNQRINFKWDFLTRLLLMK